jgi:hypothetical protein
MIITEERLSEVVGKKVYVVYRDSNCPIVYGMVKRISGGSKMDDQPEKVQVRDLNNTERLVTFSHRDVEDVCDSGVGCPSIWLKEGVT